MAEFINTVDVIGDEALTESIIDRSIAEYNDDLVKEIGNGAFYGCNKLTSVYLPAVISIATYAFCSCTNLQSADFTAVTSIGGNVFGSCTNLTALIIRNTEKICTLGSFSFSSTPIASGTGYIYVPRIFLSDDDANKDYRRATKWSAHANQFRALEDYTVDGTTTGKLDPNKI